MWANSEVIKSAVLKSEIYLREINIQLLVALVCLVSEIKTFIRIDISS